MQVTQEDGGRLNAFASEPRMEVIGLEDRRPANRVVLVAGLALVLLLVGVAALIS